MEAAQFKNIDPCLPAGAQIFEAIKFAILRMELVPGQILSESEIAEQFGASRTPVREALLQLRNVGLLMTRPSRGNYVTLLSKEIILEARFLREAIEVANVTRVCELRLNDDAKSKLEDNLADQQIAIDQYDDRLFSQLDDEFHLAIAHATGYARVGIALQREKVLLDRLRMLSLSDIDHQSTLLIEHTDIFNALQAGDQARAIEATRTHLQSILKALSSLMARHADYFEETSRLGNLA